jgi:hypothetical protein
MKKEGINQIAFWSVESDAKSFSTRVSPCFHKHVSVSAVFGGSAASTATGTMMCSL